MDPKAMAERLRAVLTSPDLPVAQALERLQEAGTGALLLARADRRLVGVLTDGDIRREILRHQPLDRRCGDIATREPVTARDPVTEADVLRLMDTGREFLVNQLPVVDADGVVVGLWLRSDVTAAAPESSAVIMAGGFGTRLRPHTDSVPKPMLPMGGRPLLERTIERLRAAGIHDVRLTTHYLGDHIVRHFGDGRAFGVEITYLPEEHPLGTAGSLAKLRGSAQPVLVMNGDILTKIDFQALHAFHREQRADITVGVRRYELQVPYGVLECDGERVTSFREKPVHRCLVNAGIYLIEPSVLALIPTDERYDMSDLLQLLLDQGRRVASFPIIEYWLDVGQHSDYERAQADAGNGLFD
jgi:dTDP-glucose pyrophosphorylase/CBS domain-containing protein